MKLSQFTLYKNTNFTDMQNTLHFNSNNYRDNWFSTYFTDDNPNCETLSKEESNFVFGRK